MANRPATVHWEIANRIIWHVAAGNTNVEAVRKTAAEYKTLALTANDISRIADALDQLSAQYQPAGYWYTIVLDGFRANSGIIPGLTEVAVKPRWGWILLAFFGGYVLYKLAR